MMDSEGSSSGQPGSDNQDSNEPAPPGTPVNTNNASTTTPLPRKLVLSAKGVEQAKKRLRAFSIQKKTPITPIPVAKASSSATGTTVLIGKLSSAKPAVPKVEDDAKKLPKPPKPGATRKNFQDSYTELQKRTLAEIEDMKRKMELVDLGIPLGLICPSSTNEKAMPTKAMPPIKTFLDKSKVDEIIRDAKKARAEGKEFKFDYSKILPDYDNPFQRKKDADGVEKDKEDTTDKEQTYKTPTNPKINRMINRGRDKVNKRKDRYETTRRHSDKYERSRKDDRDKYRDKRPDKQKDKDSRRETKESTKSGNSTEKLGEQDPKETDVNLSDYLVCDSWSLDNDDKTASPLVDDKSKATPTKEKKSKEDKESSKEAEKRREELEKEALLKAVDSPSLKKIEKLKPVIDSFEYEIDPNDDDILDMFDENSKTQSFGKVKSKKGFDYNQDSNMSDSLADDNFLESVINEIKQENLSDDDSQDKGLVEYDSPVIDYKCQGTPELDDSMRLSRASDYSDSCRSIDSGCKSSESGYRSTESVYKSDRQKSTERHKDSKREREKPVEIEKGVRESVEKDLDEALERKMSKSTMESLEIWDFVLKICQPLLFRHDKTKCYKQTRTSPSVWWATRPGACGCVRGRGVVLSELRAQRLPLVDRVYSTDQISDTPPLTKRGWYPPLDHCLSETLTLPRTEADTQAERPREADEEKQREAERPRRELGADEKREADRPKREAGDDERPKEIRRPRDAPQHGDTLLLDREYQRFMEAVAAAEVAEAQVQSRSTTPVRLETEEKKEDKGKSKLSSEGWSQESEVEEEVEKSKKQKRQGKDKTRKRKRSSSTLSSATEDDEVKRKKAKKKINKKSKAKLAKRRRTEKKYMKKLRDKQKKKKAKPEKTSEEEEVESPKKKLKNKKAKKKQKLKKIQKKKKKAKSSSSSSSSSSSDSDEKRKTKKKKKKKAEAFDVNILNNIKTEKLTDDEKNQNMIEDFSPRRQLEKRQEIIDVKELGVQIKQEVVEEEKQETETAMDEFDLSNNDELMESRVEKIEEPDRLTPQRPEDNSQCSSQESLPSEKPALYEKDDSHLRPSSQNSNYSFNDVIASQSGLYPKGIEATVECDKFEYEQENYEMYEQLAMAYQSDVATNQVPLPVESGTQRIETVMMRRRGEIKCDWRAGAAPPAGAARPSRWGLKPGEVNIVLTGGSEQYAPPEPVYRIESIANRNDNSTGYDEAYMDTYGAMDRLQYGDCFSATSAQSQQQSQQLQHFQQTQQDKERRGTLDDRIDQALRHTVLGEIAMEPENKENDPDKENRDKGILVTGGGSGRGQKRVSFADGYKPGQDSDTEEPPAKKRARAPRVGCAWPCPATHPDHVPLWDALPPPPPPPGSPPPPRAALAPPPALLRHARPPPLLRPPPLHKLDPNMPMPAFMPPEPPPGLITFQ